MEATRAARLEAELHALRRTVKLLMDEREEQVAAYETLVEQIAEQNLKLLYTMEHFRFKRRVSSALAIEQEAVELSLAQLYGLERDAFLAKLSKDIDDAEAEVAHAPVDEPAAAALGAQPPADGICTSRNPSLGETLALVSERAPRRPEQAGPRALD